MDYENSMLSGCGPYDSIIEDYYHPSPDEIAEELTITKDDFDKMFVKGNIHFSLTTVSIEFKIVVREESFWTKDLKCSIDGIECRGKELAEIISAVDCKLDESFEKLY